MQCTFSRKYCKPVGLKFCYHNCKPSAISLVLKIDVRGANCKQRRWLNRQIALKANKFCTMVVS